MDKVIKNKLPWWKRLLKHLFGCVHLRNYQKGMNMRQCYFAEVSCVEPDAIQVIVRDADDGEVLTIGRVTVENEQVRKDAAHTVLFPLEELEYGLYGEPNRKMIDGIIKSAIRQTPVMTEQQILNRQRAVEEWKLKQGK